MAEPTSALSIEDLVLRIAREIGVAYYGSDGQQEAMVPNDPHDLDLCRRIVNDGIRLFVKSSPPNGWRWMRRIMEVDVTSTEVTGTADSTSTTTLVDADLTDSYDTDGDLIGFWIYITDGTGEGSYAQVAGYTAISGTVTVADWLFISGNAGGTDPVATDSYTITPIETIEGEIYRYPLPENYGGTPDGPITYKADSNHATEIEWVDESFIRRRRSVTVTNSYPLWAATLPYEPRAAGAGPSRRFEIQFDPKPSVDDTFLFPYDLYFDKVRLEAGISSAGATTSLTDSGLANLFPDDYYNGWVMKIIDGTGKNSYAPITDYTGLTGVFTVADWLAIDGTAGGIDPSANSAYVLQPAANLHPAGMRFDDQIEGACLAKAEMLVDDLAGRGFVQDWQNSHKPDAYKQDQRSGPRSLGTMNKTGDGRRFIRDRTWNDVTYNTGS